jgi:hypothetical protein
MMTHAVDELIHFAEEWNVCLILNGVPAQPRYDGKESAPG